MFHVIKCALLAVVALLSLPAAAHGPETTPPPAGMHNAAHVHVQRGDLLIHHVWARATPPSAKTGAAYLAITNNGANADVLQDISTPVAASAMVHQTTMDNDVMKMGHVMALEIPAGATVEFAPGGYHAMLMGLTAPLVSGSSFDITLTFEKAGQVTFPVPVLAPGKSLQHTH